MPSINWVYRLGMGKRTAPQNRHPKRRASSACRGRSRSPGGRGRSRSAQTVHMLNEAKLVCAEAREKGFYPLPSNRMMDFIGTEVPTKGKYAEWSAMELRRITVVAAFREFFSKKGSNLWKLVRDASNESLQQRVAHGETLKHRSPLTKEELEVCFVVRLALTLNPNHVAQDAFNQLGLSRQIGRASCRERV